MAQSVRHCSTVRCPGESSHPGAVVTLSAPTPAHVTLGSGPIASGAGHPPVAHDPCCGDASCACLVRCHRFLHLCGAGALGVSTRSRCAPDHRCAPGLAAWLYWHAFLATLAALVCPC